MGLDFSGLMSILAKNLYSEKKVFIRELIQNGHDSIVRRKAMPLEEDHHGRIDINSRPDEDWISFTDNGIGMSESDLQAFLSSIGSSGTKKLGREQQVGGLVGQFGIGFLSGFIVAASVEVRTRKFGENQGWLWKNHGDKNYTIEPCEVKATGTSVKVFTREPADRHLLEPDEIIRVVREYCDMLSVPIHVNHSTVPVNTMVMPWERSGISEAERELDCQIYLAKTIRGDSVIETFPVLLDDKVKAGGILYISKMRTFGVRVPRNVRIYQDRMFVTNDADLLPQWAEFVSGIIETSDLTPNAARDGFIRNQAWSDLREELGNVIIQGMEKLYETNREQLSYILKYHDLGIKAACYHHDPFFEKFAHLLEWRVNRLPGDTSMGDTDDGLYTDSRSSIASHWRTLPEVLAATPGSPDRPKRLLTFTTSNAANQYFAMANAEKVLVVDASYPYESELIEAYPKLSDAPPIELVRVDRQGGGLFKDLESEDAEVRKLADAMSQTISLGGNGKLKVDARRFEPKELPAVLLNAERSKNAQEARQILSNPSQPSSIRDMAEELLRISRTTNTMRMTINANCKFIRDLAKQDYQDEAVRHLMLGVYNSSILYNAELLTASNAKIFHDQFGAFMNSSLEMISRQAEIKAKEDELKQGMEALENERRVLYQEQGSDETEPSHQIVFLMTPFSDGYLNLEQALRTVVEDRWGCQLCLARDRMLAPELRANVEAHMRQAHAFLAEISDGNPNVMFEVGRARALYPNRPMILLKATGDVPLPADLDGLLRLTYRMEASVEELAGHLDKELRKSRAIADLLDKNRGLYISAAKIKQWTSLFTLPEAALTALSNRFSTAQAWQTATPQDVYHVISRYNFDEDDADSLLRKVKRNLTLH